MKKSFYAQTSVGFIGGYHYSEVGIFGNRALIGSSDEQLEIHQILFTSD